MAKVSKEEAVQWYAQNRGLYKKLSQKIANILSELLEEANITIHGISERAKEVDSFKNKIDNPKYNDPLNQITDFSGIRVIAYVEDDLKPICKIIEENFDIDEINSGDKSEDLGIDKVGYKSIHYVAKIKSDRLKLTEYRKFKNLKFEIQIRTILQHAWAEIEHDRNYKFNGVLPPEITRRFKILAGTLELIDREFNQLSKDIDEISRGVIIAENEDKLDEVPISTTTIKQFLTNRFSKEIEEGWIFPELYNANEIIEELNDFGIKTLKDFDSIIPAKIKENLKRAFTKHDPATFLGLIRDVMIIKDSKKYFENAWNQNWLELDRGASELYKHYKIDAKKLIDTYNLFEDF